MNEPQPPTPREPLLDHEDWLYVAATCCIGCGAAWLSPAWGLICVGLLLLWWPVMARLLATGKGPRP